MYAISSFDAAGLLYPGKFCNSLATLERCRLQVCLRHACSASEHPFDPPSTVQTNKYCKPCEKNNANACTARNEVACQHNIQDHQSVYSTKDPFSPSHLPMIHAQHVDKKAGAVMPLHTDNMQQCCLSTCSCILPVQQHQACYQHYCCRALSSQSLLLLQPGFETREAPRKDCLCLLHQRPPRHRV